jgi:hypothetical protein
MEANYEKTVPEDGLLSLRTIDESGFIGIAKMKKLIKDGEIEFVKIGCKNHIARDVLINFLKRNTFSVKSGDQVDIKSYDRD